MDRWISTAEERWVTNIIHRWVPVDIFPSKNFISKTKIPYHFIAKDTEHIYKSNLYKYHFKSNISSYHFVAKDDKYLNKT